MGAFSIWSKLCWSKVLYTSWSMACCSFVALAAPISIFYSSNCPSEFSKCQVFLPRRMGQRSFCRKFDLQACSQGSQIVPAPTKSAGQCGDHDPYNVDDHRFQDFVTACSQAFKANGWVHVPFYLGVDETRNLLSEANRHLENVSIHTLISHAHITQESCALLRSRCREGSPKVFSHL